MTQEQQAVINKTAEFIKSKFTGEGTGHDWCHMYRVWQLSKTIASSEESVNMYVVELGALLHDISDWKFNDGDEEPGAIAARELLSSLSVEEDIIVQIEDIIRTDSFKGAGVAYEMKTLEGKIVQDADKLDAIGAIGIARTFAYGGSNDREMYDPEVAPEQHDSFQAYKDGKGHTINHFYEKLLLLKDRMHTQSAKNIAQQRHDYMRAFLDEFYSEWDGKR